jgi:thiol:disulfide interchange protein DsbA
MDRRTMLSMLAGAVATPSFAQLAKSPSPDAVDSKPYDVLQPAIAADRKRVRLLFAYDCPFCLRYHNGLVSWGASLPKSVTFDAFPVIANLDNESVPMAIVGRLIGQALDHKVLPAYDYAMFTAIQGDPQTGAMPKGTLNMDQVLNALVEAGINRTYQLKATPSIAIGGRYVINPDHTQGNPQNLLLLLNGVVSRVVQGDFNAL